MVIPESIITPSSISDGFDNFLFLPLQYLFPNLQPHLVLVESECPEF